MSNQRTKSKFLLTSLQGKTNKENKMKKFIVILALIAILLSVFGTGSLLGLQAMPAAAAEAGQADTLQTWTGVQLVVYAGDRSIRLVDLALPQAATDKPYFNSFLPLGGGANGVAYFLDSTGQTQALALDAAGIRQLSFIKNPGFYGLAVYSGAQPKLAWSSVVQSQGGTGISTLQISGVDGSGLDTLFSQEIDASFPTMMVPHYWSADGQWLYFSKEPMGLGGYILYGGASNLYKTNILTSQVKELIPQAPANGSQACMDSTSADYRYVADHCTYSSITVRDLFYDNTTSIQVPQEIASLMGSLGSARFSPDGKRVAFAVARNNPSNEQSWVAVSDSLSGGSKLVITSKMGSYYTVAGWLDSQTILVQSTDLTNCGPNCVSDLWAVKADGSQVTKVADGSLITVVISGYVPNDNLLPTPIPPTPRPVVPTPTATPQPCNLATFVKDVSIPDGTLLDPSDDFTKTWRLKNVGSCTWTTDYDLVFRSGDQMDGKNAIALTKSVKPGETVDLSVSLTAPDDSGEYTGYWALRDGNGRIFGIGPNGDKAFWVNIEVRAATRLAYDFTAHYCEATWSTSRMASIPCPSLPNRDGGINPPGGTPPGAVQPGTGLPGMVTVDPSVIMETGYRDNEPALITSPDLGEDGLIRGVFPAFKVKDGDRLRTIIGCTYESYDCNVSMTISYSINGGEAQQLGKWVQTYDEDITRIDLDLSFLAGKNVTFIFTTRARDDGMDNMVFWLMPRIMR
jgi:hypothetical protein